MSGGGSGSSGGGNCGDDGGGLTMKDPSNHSTEKNFSSLGNIEK